MYPCACKICFYAYAYYVHNDMRMVSYTNFPMHIIAKYSYSYGLNVI